MNWRNSHDVRGVNCPEHVFDYIENMLKSGEAVRLVATPILYYDVFGASQNRRMGLAITSQRVIIARAGVLGIKSWEYPIQDFLRYGVRLFNGGGPSWEVVEETQRGRVKFVFSTHDEADSVAEYINSGIALLGADQEVGEHRLVAERGATAPTARQFLRVWTAQYDGPETYPGRTVSGQTSDEVIAKARRRAPDGSRLVYMARTDDLEEVWTEAGGFTSAADQSHEFTSPAPQLFKDLAIGEGFRRNYSTEIRLEKIDPLHARNVSKGNEFELDPYDGVYPSY